MSPKRLLRLTTCCLAAAAALELSARVDDWIRYRAPLTGRYSVETIYEPRGETLHGRPGARFKKWGLNALGFRGPDPAPRSVRVACMGSSETFGLYEQEGREWPRALERQLHGAQPPVSVVNAAYPGMNLRSYRLQLPGLAGQAGVSAIVVYPSLANYIRTDMIRSVHPPPLPSAWDWRFADKLRDGVKEVLPEAIMTPLRKWTADLAARDLTVMQRIPEENVELFRADLDILLDEIAAREIRVVLVTHATYFHGEVTAESRPLLTAWRRFYPMLAEDGFLDMERRLNDQIRASAKRRGLPLVDAAQRLAGGRRNFTEFVHFTDEGAEELANLIAPAVRQVLASPPSSPGR